MCVSHSPDPIIQVVNLGAMSGPGIVGPRTNPVLLETELGLAELGRSRVNSGPLLTPIYARVFCQRSRNEHYGSFAQM